MEQLWTIIERATGKVLSATWTTSSADEHPSETGWSFDNTTQECIAIDQRPDPSRDIWDGSAWVLNLDAAKSRAWAAVKAARDHAEWGGCETELGRVDTDPDSQRKVSGSVQMAMIAAQAGAPFAIGWTMQNNTTAVHDAQAMISMGVAVGQHVGACHAVAVARRDAIMAATTVEDVEAVEADSGWPGEGLAMR